ncbi:hypothetical protein [Burkholderia gladioli]|uniref:hypothetical protein n=1 Tax=Burkholderia gladioli TaxID=28095 RepID=UPI001F227922|nr:hypothetical protein [Burkholderia gladioli]
MPTREMLYTEVEPLIREHGKASFEIGSIPITLELSHRHERYYAASLLLDIRYPQGDVDRALFRHFVKAGDQVLDAGANIGVTALELLEAGAPRDRGRADPRTVRAARQPADRSRGADRAGDLGRARPGDDDRIAGP